MNKQQSYNCAKKTSCLRGILKLSYIAAPPFEVNPIMHSLLIDQIRMRGRPGSLHDIIKIPS